MISFKKLKIFLGKVSWNNMCKNWVYSGSLLFQKSLNKSVKDSLENKSYEIFWTRMITGYILELSYWLHIHCPNVMLTCQWLKRSCGLAKPDVRFLISSASPKLSTTGNSLMMLNTWVPSLSSSDITRPLRLPITAYSLPESKNNSQ